VSICLAAVAQKYKAELDPRYKLPKMKYKGGQVQIQRIRKVHQTRIQEVSADSAPMPGESKQNRQALSKKAQTEGPPQPQFCIFYSKPGAQIPDGFDLKWPHQPDTAEEANGMEHLYGSDLPCYRVNLFQENIRGTMKSKTGKEEDRTDRQDDEAAGAPPGERETQEMLRGRSCVVQVRMPNLSQHTQALKQFGVEVSDECLRISFPLLPRLGHAAYSPLTLWWPRPFFSMEAAATWDTQSDTLTVVLPTDSPDCPAAFDEDLLNAVF